MRFEVEKRLHRVKIILDKENINCPYSKNCDKATFYDIFYHFYKKNSPYNI